MLAEPNPSRQKSRAKNVTKSRVGVELALAGEKEPKGAQKLADSDSHLMVSEQLDRSEVQGSLSAGKKKAGITEFHPSNAP